LILDLLIPAKAPSFSLSDEGVVLFEDMMLSAQSKNSGSFDWIASLFEMIKC